MAIELNGAPESVAGPIRNALFAAAKTEPTTYSAKQTFSAGVALSGLNLEDAATIQWDLAAGGFAAVEIAANRSLQLLNLTPGVQRQRVTQGTGGGHTLTIAAGLTVRTPGGTPITLSAAAGAVDWLTIICHAGTTIDVITNSDFQEI